MIVYVDNRLETAKTLTSPNENTDAPISNVYHAFLDLTAEFTAKNVVISGAWADSIAADTFIIGLSNAETYQLILKNAANAIIYNSDVVYKDDALIEILDLSKGLLVRTFTLTLTGYDNIRVGLLYLGEALDIGLFAVGPVYTREFTGEGNRAMGGQVYGLRKITLRSFSATFPNVDNTRRALIEAYLDDQLQVEPHVINPYPQARDAFPPMYATLESGLSATKRERDGFWWDFELTWKEAK
jgi:hypothetical protein